MEKLIKTFTEFVAQSGTIVRNPWTFPDKLGIYSANAFISGIKFLSLASGVTYILLLPACQIHDKSIGESLIMLLNIVALFAAGLFFHLGLKILGSRGISIGETLGLYSFHLGMQLVVFTILTYPNMLRYGPAVLIGGMEEDVNKLANQPELLLSYFVILLVAMAVGFIWLMTCWIPMYARYNRFETLGKIRATIAYIFGIVIATPILIHFLGLVHRFGRFL